VKPILFFRFLGKNIEAGSRITVQSVIEPPDWFVRLTRWFPRQWFSLAWLPNQYRVGVSVLGGLVFWLVVYLGQLFNPSYSFLDQLSRLGGTGAVAAWIFNAGVITAGGLAIAYCYLLMSQVRTLPSAVGLLFFVVAFVFLILIGSFRWPSTVHLVSLILFLSFALSGGALMGVGLRLEGYPRRGWVIIGMSFLGGAVSLLLPWLSEGPLEIIGISLIMAILLTVRNDIRHQSEEEEADLTVSHD
jgi:hypothetical membrane protein